MNEQLLKDFIATAQKYNYNWNKAFGLFPELKGYDQQVLKDYVATAEKFNYNYKKVNSLFPELGFGEPSKKKEPTASGSNLEKPTSGSSSRWDDVTVEPSSKKKYRTDDYIDQVQNAQRKAKAPTQKVESTFEQPKETKPPVKFDVLSEKEAMQMMAEDFGKKEFEAYSSIEKIPSANKLKDLDEETTANILNKQFEGTNLEFKKLGWQLTVTSKIGDGINSTVLNEKTIDLSDPNADKQLKSFVSNNLVKKSEREQFENAQSVEDLVELVGSNPNKFKASLLEGMDVEKYFERERQLLNGEMARAKADTYDSDLKSYEQKVVKFNQDVKGGKMSKADFDARSNALETERKALMKRRDIMSSVIGKAEKIDSLTKNLEKANVITTAEREKQGSLTGLVLRGIGEGLTDVSQAMIDFGIAGVSAVSDAKTLADAITPGEYERLKRLGFSDDQIKNEIQKSVKNKANQVLRSVPDAFGLGTTEEYAKSADRGIIEQAAYALGESLGAVGGGVATAGTNAGFFAMSYNALEDQMRGPQFDALTENEKKIMSVPYGLVIGALEKLGAKVATTAAKNKTLGMFSEYIMAKTFSSLPKNASLLEIKSAIDKSIAASVANGMIKITGAGIVEGGTEFTQQIFEGIEKDVANRIIQSNQLEAAKEEGGGTVSKEIYDKIVENKFFKDAADLTTSEGIQQLLKESGNAFLVGAVAGGMGGTMSVGIAEPISNKISNNKFAVYRDIILNDDAREGAISSINKKVEDNELTREEADQQIKSINESYPALRQIPSSFSLSSQREAFGLLREKDQLQKEIDGKDPSLVAKQKDRIAEIETQLKGLSYAVQEQSTDAIPVQPTTGVGGEMAQGAPETGLKETAQKGQEEVDQYIADMGAEARIGSVINPIMDKMANAEYINDNDIDNAITTIFNEVEQLEKSDKYSPETKAAISDKLLNIAEKLDNYEFRTKTETVEVTKAGATTATRKTSEAVRKIRAEKYFNAVQATVNGQEVTLQDKNGRVEAPMPNGEVIVLDTPSMEISEGGFEFDKNDALVSVTVNDRLGNTVKLTGDQALDFAIRDRENKLGIIEQAEFDTVYQEVERQYVKEAKPMAAEAAPVAVVEEAPVVTEAVVTPEIDPNEKFTFSEDKVPAALKGVEPIGRTEVGKRGFLGLRRGKPTVTLTYSGQQLIDAGINQSTIQNEEFTKTSERTEAQARPENDGRADQAVRENAKRENVKTSIQRLRDQGLLVTAKAKGGKMTDAEINAFMALSDAMAKVWKQTTGQNNFYDTFIDQVKQGDLNAIKEKGGVLFQDIEVPQRPVSRVTLAAFETPAFKQMRGKEVSIDQVRNLTKSLNKPIEKDIINEVLSYEKYQGKKMSFDEFRNDVEVQLMKLEPLVTNRWKNYGKTQLGDNHDYGEGESVILNSPIDHGYTHPIHWEESDFSYGNLKSTTRWETRQLPGTNQYVAIDSDIPAGLVGEEIVEYIGMSGNKDQVDKWVKLRSKGPTQWDEEVNIGMFGHFRNWFNKGSKIFTIAELQSDWFRYKKSDDIYDKYIDHQKVIDEANELIDKELPIFTDKSSKLNKEFSEKYNLSIENSINKKGDEIELTSIIKDSKGEIIQNYSLKIPLSATKNKQLYIQEDITSSALRFAIEKISSDLSGKNKVLLLNKAKESDSIIEQQLKDIDTILNFDAETNYFSSDEKGRILSDLERNQFRWEEVMNNARNIRTFEEAQKEVDDLRNILNLLRPESLDIYVAKGIVVVNRDQQSLYYEYGNLRSEYQQAFLKQNEIAENNAIEELKNSKEGDLILKQFLASAKVYETRLLREAIKYAAKKGATELWFPTPFTESSLQGHINKTRDGNAPYRIIYQSRQGELSPLDMIETYGNEEIVLEVDSTTAQIADKEDVVIFDRVNHVFDKANDYAELLKRDLSDQFSGDFINKEDFQSGKYKRNLEYAYVVNDEIENWFELNPDEDVLFWQDIYDNVVNTIEQDLDSQSNEDLFGYGYKYYQFGATIYQVDKYNIHEVYQPKEYLKGANKEYEGWENDLQKPEFIGVVNKYKDLNKLLTKIRPDAKIEVDNNGFEWLSTKITAEDLMNPVIAFQNEGAKVKGAVDFSNDNKASIYLFDGADISTLAHEVSGHVGRRMLAKLAETDKGFRKDYEAAMKWAGAKDGEWSVAAEEKFARGFERYLQTGKAPFEELRSVFEKLRTWLTNIYKQIRGSSIDVKLTPEITRVFDNLLRVKTKEKPMAENKMKSVMAIVKQGKEQGKTDEEIRKDAMDAGFVAKDAANALAMYYAQGEGIFTRSGKTGVTTRLYEYAKKYAQQYLTSKGLMPKIGFNLKERMEGEISKEANRAVNTAKKFGKLFDKTKEDKELLLEDFDNYIRGDKSVQLPNEFIGVANEMRNHIDTLSQMLINNGAVTGEMADIIKGNIGSYLSRSYEIYDNKNFRNKVGDELVNQARNFLRTQPGTILEAKAEADKRGIPLNQAIEGILDNKIGDLFADVKLEGFFKGSKVGAKDLSTLKFRQDIPEQLRMLMGQYSDPAMNYARTVNKLIHLAAQHKFLSDVREAGFGKFFFEKGDALRPAGYNTQIAAKGSEVMAPLNGLYTTPEIFEAFQKQFNQKEIGAVMTFLYRVMGITKWLKTIASAATHMKNVFSNIGFVMANGHNILKLGPAIKIVANDLRTMSKPEVQAKIDEYIEAGIMRQGAGINEIRDMFKDANLDRFLEKRLSLKQPKNLMSKVKRAIGSPFIGFKTIAEALYQAEDDMFKIAAYENEVARYANSWYNKKPADLTEAERKIVVDKAADNVKNTYPTYSRIPEGIKQLRKFPLFIGSFISFQAESYRTAFNTIALAKEELLSGNKKLRTIGASRIAGATAYLTIKNAILSYFGMALGTGLSGVIGAISDDDEEKEKEKDVREFLPPWSKDSDIIPIKKSDGTIEYIDFSASDPHGALNKALNAFFRGDDLLDKFSKGLLATIEPFVGPDITVGLAMQLANNENDFGGKIYNEEDTFAEKTRKIADFVYKVIEPGTITSVRKVWKDEQPLMNSLFGEATGMKIRPLEVKKQFEFKMDTYADEFAEIKRIYNSEYNKTLRMMEDPKVTKKELAQQEKKTEEAFNRANAQYAAKGKELMNLINAANRLGVDYDELIEAVKTKNVMNSINLFEIQQDNPAQIEEKYY